MPVLAVGTRNPKKREEILGILGDLPIEVRDLTAWPDTPDVIEDGETLEENALKKARQIAAATRSLALGDDTGLEVDALGGAPGIRSARCGRTSHAQNCPTPPPCAR